VHEPALSWVRLVVDDFSSAYATHRRTMTPTGIPLSGDDKEFVERGYARLWRCGRDGPEVELVDRARAREYLGPERAIEDRTLVYYTPDVDQAFETLARRYEPVLPPSGHPRSAPGGERYAQFRKPDGTLMEISVTWIPGFGSLLGAGV
jgi:hypothetical protein